MMETKVSLWELETKQIGENIFEGWATKPVVDLDNEIIDPRGVNLSYYLKNPIILWMHDRKEPIGKTLDIFPSDEGIRIRFQLSSVGKACDVATWIREGIVRALSIGFSPRRTTPRGDGVRVVEEWDLFEISVITLPANYEALIDVKTLVNKLSTPFADLPIHADLEYAWDADASEVRVRRLFEIEGREDLQNEDKRNNYRKRFFWYDPPGENFGDYKLPFADAVGGELRAIWRGVASAMAALLGARGGVEIPEAERRSVYNHIVRYYKKFEKEPPDFHLNYNEFELRQIETFGKVILQEDIREIVIMLLEKIRQISDAFANIKEEISMLVESFKTKDEIMAKDKSKSLLLSELRHLKRLLLR